MPKVMMPVEVVVGRKHGATYVNIFVAGKYQRDFLRRTKDKALAAAKEWVLENGGTWEEEE